MALIRSTTYPGRFSSPTAGQPQGAFKNRTTPTSADGSYLEQQWANDWSGFFSALLDSAGITPDGSVDEVGASQYFDALVAVIKRQRRLGEPFWHMGDAPPLNAMEYDGQILSRSTYADLWADINNPDNGFTVVTQAQSVARPGCWHSGDGSTTFGVPKLLGEFLRVWDSTGLIDAGRVFGSHQDDQSLHVDEFYSFAPGGGTSGAKTIPADGSYSANGLQSSSADPGIGLKFKMNAAETRPDNTAMMLCFWYQ